MALKEDLGAAHDPVIDSKEYLHRIARELTTIRTLTAQAVNHILNAEAEIPERMRRFTNYMHDIHDVKFMYEELGHPAPQWLSEELLRVDDRFRQLLQELHAAGGTFEKVRREMAADPENRWDHTKQLGYLKPTKEKVDEAGPSVEGRDGEYEEGADPSQDQPSSSGSAGPVRRL